jgi:hypothetical protein
LGKTADDTRNAQNRPLNSNDDSVFLNGSLLPFIKSLTLVQLAQNGHQKCREGQNIPNLPFLNAPELDFVAVLMLLPFKSSPICPQCKLRLSIQVLLIPLPKPCFLIHNLAFNSRIQRSSADSRGCGGENLDRGESWALRIGIMGDPECLRGASAFSSFPGQDLKHRVNRTLTENRKDSKMTVLSPKCLNREGSIQAFVKAKSGLFQMTDDCNQLTVRSLK